MSRLARLTLVLCFSAGLANAAPIRVHHHTQPVELAAGGDPFGGARFSYQGELLDGDAAYSGIVDLRFVFFEGSVASPGSELGTTVVLDVPVSAGRFSTVVPLAYLPSNFDTYLVVSVQRATDPQFVVLGAQPMTPVPMASYAQRAGRANSADLPWQPLPGGAIGYLQGRVAIGTATPEGKLHLQGGATDSLALHGADGVPKLHFRNAGNSRDWVFRHDGSNFHLQRELADGHESMSWTVDGNVGIGNTSPAARLDVSASDAAQPALRVQHTASGANNAIAGRFDVSGQGSGGSSAFALVGVANATSGSSVGVLARNESSSGIAQFAFATATTGLTTGVLARNSSSAGIAVDAWSSASSGTPTALRARVQAPGGYAARLEGGTTFVERRLGVGIEAPASTLHINGEAGSSPLRADIAGAAKLLVHSNGGVSIGSASVPPANGLHISGPISLAAQPRWFSISGKAFNIERSAGFEIDSWNFDGLSVAGPNGQAVYFSAPLLLPHGAVITELRGLVTDLSPVEGISLQIVRRVHADAGFGVIATASSNNGTLGQQTLSDTSVLSSTVDNELYAYDLRAFWTLPNAGNDFDIRLNTVRVSYTVTSPLP
jgi:hypothetical protein